MTDKKETFDTEAAKQQLIRIYIVDHNQEGLEKAANAGIISESEHNTALAWIAIKGQNPTKALAHMKQAAELDDNFTDSTEFKNLRTECSILQRDRATIRNLWDGYPQQLALGLARVDMSEGKYQDAARQVEFLVDGRKPLKAILALYCSCADRDVPKKRKMKRFKELMKSDYRDLQSSAAYIKRGRHANRGSQAYAASNAYGASGPITGGKIVFIPSS